MGMHLSDEQLQELEEFASYLISPDEIAIIMQVDDIELKNEIRSREGAVFLAFMRGKLKTEALLRKTTITFAKQGSSPALSAALKLRDELNATLLKR